MPADPRRPAGQRITPASMKHINPEPAQVTVLTDQARNHARSTPGATFAPIWSKTHDSFTHFGNVAHVSPRLTQGASHPSGTHILVR